MFETNICLKEICLMPLVLSRKDEKPNKVHHSFTTQKVFKKVLKKCLENWHGLNLLLAILCIPNLIPFKVCKQRGRQTTRNKHAKG
jgi:hypothetical protein